MKMESFEQQIKEKLRQRKAEDYLQMLEEPEMRHKMLGILETGIGTLVNAFAQEGELDAEKAASLKSDLSAELHASLSNPLILQRAAEQSAKTSYMSQQELRVYIASILQKDSEEEQLKSALDTYMQDPLVQQHLHRHEAVMAGLIQVAERDGLENALSKEAEHAMLRQVYPTAESYLAAHQAESDVMQGLIDKTMSLMVVGSDNDPGVVSAVRIVRGWLGSVQVILKSAQLEWLERKVRDVYGTS